MHLARRTVLSVVTLLLIVAGVACIKKSSGTVTPMERVTTDNALFAEANSILEQGAEAAASSGVITTTQARPVIAFNGQVAAVHKQVTAILRQGTTATGEAYNQIADMMTQLQTSATALINSGSAGFKNPKSQQQAVDEVNRIVNLGRAILVDVQMVHAATKGGS